MKTPQKLGPRAGVVDAESDRAKPLRVRLRGAESNFQKRVVRFVSDYARQRLGLSTFKSLYSIIIGNTDPGKSVENGRIFETMVFRLLHGGWRPEDGVQRGGALERELASTSPLEIVPGARTRTLDVSPP